MEGHSHTKQQRETGWFEIPWDYICMYVTTGDLRELYGKADWVRYKKIECKMFNFMALNNNQQLEEQPYLQQHQPKTCTCSYYRRPPTMERTNRKYKTE